MTYVATARPSSLEGASPVSTDPLPSLAALPVATYRLQLREGVTFDAAESLIPHLCRLGISHLYLSPIFRAGSGSSHGYDITDPTEIEPELGGREGFSRLARTAGAAGIGIILDAVPNHTAFSLENPWLVDVLRHGQKSRHAPAFDIDWTRGRLLLPFLAEPFEARLRAGAIGLADGPDGPVMWDGEIAVPLAPGTLPRPELRSDPHTIRAVHEAQHWRLAQWGTERDSITHRRFFNVTGLIGMRVEDAKVFEATHALLFDLIDAGEVAGLRLDHVDGLADPTTYLAQLRARLPGVPIWVEKILTGDEVLPDWPVEGTTGYEAGRAIAQVLTDAGGLARLDTLWRAETGITEDFATTLATAKTEVIRQDLAAELHQLIALARSAADAVGAEIGDEALREAILALLEGFPRYRSYFNDEPPRAEDLALMSEVVEAAAPSLRSDAVLRRLAAMITDAATPEDVAFRTRFQQVTGALIAKAHEDTAAFRYARYLAASEVGAEPDHAALTPEAFGAFLAERLARQPAGLTLTSSHDTKRAEDARMRLVAISHLPEDFAALAAAAGRLPEAAAVPPNLRWYAVQSLLALWDPAPEAETACRLARHMEKAMREAKEISNWTHPDTAAEAGVCAFARALVADWTAQADGLTAPAAAARLIARGEALSMAQLALKLTIPGIPDIYQGAEGATFALTDPDNRRAVDFTALTGLCTAPGLAGRKARLTVAMLALRRAGKRFFATAEAIAGPLGPEGGLWMERRGEEGVLRVEIGAAANSAFEGSLIWPEAAKDGRTIETAILQETGVVRMEDTARIAKINSAVMEKDDGNKAGSSLRILWCRGA